MIELIADDRCTRCNLCVRACPNDVFDIVAHQAPRIARPQDCHTCFLCELYCPVDAIYVSPIALHGISLPAQREQAWGSYAAASGWLKGRPYMGSGTKAPTGIPAQAPQDHG